MTLKAIIKESMENNPLAVKSLIEENLLSRIKTVLESKCGDEDEYEEDEEDEDEKPKGKKKPTEIEIHEISSGLLGRYIQKATSDSHKRSNKIKQDQ